jgi:hypothetical protein
MGEFERFFGIGKMSLLSEQFDERALPGVGKISAIFLLITLAGGLPGHVVARVALSICCLMFAFRTGILGSWTRGACHFESAPPTAGPASGPEGAILVYLPNA